MENNNLKTESNNANVLLCDELLAVRLDLFTLKNKQYEQIMYLGKAESVYITGFDKQAVIDGADKYCKENEGWMLWSNVYSTRKQLGWFKWKTEYRIDLYKPIDFEIRRK